MTINMATKSITSFLTSPSKVAHALDWKKSLGTVLSVNISRQRIDLAVASHPEKFDPVLSLPGIPLTTSTIENRRILDRKVLDELSAIIHDWKVCGLVVSWPVQKEGWCGAPCGRVLRTLDQITAQSSNILTKGRPVCLWDEEHHEPQEDEWGRAAVYSETSLKDVHIASEEQYQDHDTVAADVWDDFCRSHWPELYGENLSSERVGVDGTCGLYDYSWHGDAYDTHPYPHEAASAAAV